MLGVKNKIKRLKVIENAIFLLNGDIHNIHTMTNEVKKGDSEPPSYDVPIR